MQLSLPSSPHHAGVAPAVAFPPLPNHARVAPAVHWRGELVEGEGFLQKRCLTLYSQTCQPPHATESLLDGSEILTEKNCHDEISGNFSLCVRRQYSKVIPSGGEPLSHLTVSIFGPPGKLVGPRAARRGVQRARGGTREAGVVLSIWGDQRWGATEGVHGGQ